MNTQPSSILNRYLERTPGSAKLAAAAQQLLPSGVNHDGRLTTPYPIYVRRAAGPRKWDVDGNEYVDYFGGHGSLLLGHCHRAVSAALKEQATLGTHFGACHELEIEWASLVRELVPSAEKVRFTSSGTEATLLALRVARAHTGKRKLLRVRGHFHGWHDHMTSGYVNHFDGSPTPGVIPGIVAETVLVDADDLPGLQRAFEAGDIAAAIVEPNGGHFARLPLADDFLREMRRLTLATGALLIFDEVVTGFRVAPGGYQSIVGITPDITTLAKILAGGLPGGALAARADVLDAMDVQKTRERGVERVAHQGTFNANPMSAAAGVATLREIVRHPHCAAANATAKKLRDGMNALFVAEGVRWFAYGEYSGFHIFVNPRDRALEPGVAEPSVLVPDLLSGLPSLLPYLRTGLLARGVDINAAGSGWVSATHGDAEVDATLQALREVLVDFRRDSLVP